MREHSELKVLRKLNKYEFEVELHVIREGLNRNKWDYQNIDKCYQSFLGQPILIAYVNGKIGDGHNMECKKDANGNTYYSFVDGTCERIVGTISNEPSDLRIVEEDGQKWLVAKGRLFTFYAKELVDKIVKQGVMEVSAETEVYRAENGEDCEIFLDWAGFGVTILGDGVAPAVPNARIEKFAAMREEFNSVCLKAAAYIEDGGKEDNDPIDNKKPQNKSNKGERKVKALSKKELAELSPKFDGYDVLSGVKTENGIHVALMSEDGTTATYTLGSMNDIVVPEKITKVTAKVLFEQNDDYELACDSYEMTDRLSATLVATKNDLASTKESLDTANNTINVMKDAEMKRRKAAAKAKSQATLKEFNANREEKVDAKVLAEIDAAIENGEFANCEVNGEWTGEKEVANKVLAACASEVMKMDEETARKKATQFSWQGIKEEKVHGLTGVEALLDSFEIH